MAGIADGLPVVFVPEQVLVALVWNDVVDDGCRSYQTLLLAKPAKRVLFQKGQPRLAPSMAIATLSRSPALSIMGLLMLAAVLIAETFVREFWAPRLATR